MRRHYYSLLFGMEGDLIDAGPGTQARPPCDPHHTVTLVEAQPQQLPALTPVPPTLVPTVENLQAVHPATRSYINLETSTSGHFRLLPV